MSGVFDEKRMTKFLDRYIPDGEVLRAGIHGIGLETEVRQVFGNCSLVGEEIVPREKGSQLKLMLPKRGGVGGGMPNHTKYREEIIACLSNLNCAHA